MVESWFQLERNRIERKLAGLNFCKAGRFEIAAARRQPFRESFACPVESRRVRYRFLTAQMPGFASQSGREGPMTKTSAPQLSDAALTETADLFDGPLAPATRRRLANVAARGEVDKVLRQARKLRNELRDDARATITL
jgi:hypothetical protein